jgi:hypothetical protein
MVVHHILRPGRRWGAGAGLTSAGGIKLASAKFAMIERRRVLDIGAILNFTHVNSVDSLYQRA